MGEVIDLAGQKRNAEIEALTSAMLAAAAGKNAAHVVGAAINVIQTCCNYGDEQFQRLCGETLRSMGNTMLQITGKPR